MDRREFLARTGRASALAVSASFGLFASSILGQEKKPQSASGPLRVSAKNPRYFCDASGHVPASTVQPVPLLHRQWSTRPIVLTSWRSTAVTKALFAIFAALNVGWCANLNAQTGPWVNGVFQGRIALSHDGNFNDEDDWAAFPLSIAVLDAYGVLDKVVHIEFNNIIQDNDPGFEQEMTASVLGAAERYGIPASVLHNCRADLVGAIKSITGAVNASSAESPLYYLVVGPMDVPYYGIVAADPAKRQHVYCISHSWWNDGFGNRKIRGLTKRHLIELGVKWIQTLPGHQPGGLGLTNSHQNATPEQWALIDWMRDSRDERLRWVYARFQAEDRVDACDTACTYFLLSGDEHGSPQKLAALLEKQPKSGVNAVRTTIRLEAENFELQENCSLVYGSQFSQRLMVRTTHRGKGIIRSPFHEIHAAQSGRYRVGIRCRASDKGVATFTFRVNGVQQGTNWKLSEGDGAWKTLTVNDVLIAAGDEIVVDIRTDADAAGELDYIQLGCQGVER